MSRWKRIRKARSAARRAKRDARFFALCNRIEGDLQEMQDRVRFRRELNASDAPDAVKTVLGMLADPIGYIAETLQRSLITESRCVCKTATSRAYGAEAPLGRVRDPECPIHSSCPHCLSNNIRASLQKVTTARGEVQHCWQCGGEYRDGVKIWPEEGAAT